MRCRAGSKNAVFISCSRRRQVASGQVQVKHTGITKRKNLAPVRGHSIMSTHSISASQRVEDLALLRKAPPPKPAPRLWCVTLLLLLFGLSGCSGSPSILTPASRDAAQIADLFWGVLAIAAGIFVVTEALLIIALVRFRS